MAPILVNVLTALLAASVGCEAFDKQTTARGDRSWHEYVRSPKTSIVTPKAILAANTSGDVSNPAGMLGWNRHPTVLTRKQGSDDVPSVIVDFGQNVVGILAISFAGSTNSSAGFPGLKLAFSETQQYLTNVSDFTRSDNLPAVSYTRPVWEDKY